MSDGAGDQGMPLPEGFPTTVYLPCQEHVRRAEDAALQLREVDGRLALLAYSTLEQLHGCCGAAQPWLAVPSSRLDALWQVARFEMILLDVVIADEQRVREVS